ncbi:dynein light intermediate chain [Saccharomyces eubayanus]|uniref:dynein light intermediate chain n=1 Tax=Saccharomyces eubayanus TaxID=1080349 RepID=UPI0006BFFE81|nr:DYN3-like protein [Saccharomyces eubayanus]KOG97628.1 DYN3-like protein [Saccharomyces eubayanus]
MMSNAWDKLLAQNEPVANAKETFETTVIIYSPSRKTLQQFTTICFPEGTSPALDTSLINYATIGWTSDSDQCYTVDVYTLIKNSADTLDLLKPFLQEPTSKVHWLILLDWSLNDQKLWLNELFGTFNKIKQLNDNNNISLWCLNSSEIFNLQRNTTAWQSAHIDFILQTLRSFCHFNESSLIYVDEDSSEDEEEETQKLRYQEILKRIIEGRDIKRYIEMVKRSRIVIPKGCDSIGLIKTIDERFEPSELGDDQFLDKYTDFVPAIDVIRDNGKPCYDLDKLHPLSSFQVDIQEELGKMFAKHRESSKV